MPSCNQNIVDPTTNSLFKITIHTSDIQTDHSTTPALIRCYQALTQILSSCQLQKTTNNNTHMHVTKNLCDSNFAQLSYNTPNPSNNTISCLEKYSCETTAESKRITITTLITLACLITLTGLLIKIFYRPKNAHQDHKPLLPNDTGKNTPHP